MARLRHAVSATRAALLSMGVVASAEPARAQSCHSVALVPVEEPGTAWNAEGTSEIASFDNTRYSGHFEGLTARLGLDRGWLHARVSVPYFWLVRNGLASQGLGDVSLDVLARALESADGAWRAGLRAGATLPSGDAENELGMGHAMVTGGAWGGWSGARTTVQTQLSYMRALASPGGVHAHHGAGTHPLVNPMGMSELGASLVARYLPWTSFGFHAGLYGALPVADSHGVARAVSYLGVDLVRTSFYASLEGHLPLAGDPFTAKAVGALGTTF